MKMWTGRFSKELDSIANDFNSSIHIDHRMIEEDIRGSLAHVRMLHKQKIINDDDFSKINNGLLEILKEYKDGILEIDYNAEDIHMFIEEYLTKKIGNSGKKLHTSRSRNDQVALDNRLYIKNQINQISNELYLLNNRLLLKASENFDTIMPGYTHMQIAQPVTFAHHLLAYVQMFLRDLGRLNDTKNRLNECPLGACALATTTYNIDRFYTSDLLGFSKPMANSLDAVSDRDFMIELLSNISIIFMHLSRLSEELIIWSTHEFQFITMDDSYSTGSSIMPQKKNPDMAELIRGKTGRCYGNLMAALTMMKSLPLAYNKDMQEDKEITFDSIDSVLISLKVMSGMIEAMKVNKDIMRVDASKGFINATDCADYLVKKGMPFRDAYKITGEIVKECVDNRKSIEALSLSELKKHCELFDDDIYSFINLEYILNRRSTYGGPSPSAVSIQWDEAFSKNEEYKNGN